MRFGFMVVLAAGLVAGCGRAPSVAPDKAAAADDAVLVIASAQQFDEAVLKSDKPVLVDFWATWCPPCRVMNPIVAEMAGQYEGDLVVAKVDVDENRELAERFQVRAIPTFVIVHDGEVIAAQEGAMRAEAFGRWVREQLKQKGVELPTPAI